MALPTTISAQGATVAFGTSAWPNALLSINIGPFTRTAKPVTNLSTTGFQQFKPGTLVNAGTLGLRVQFDPNNPPPITSAAETVTLTFPVPSGLSTGATLIGTGFISEYSVDGSGGDEEEVTAEVTVTWDGNTGPAWTDAA